MNKPLSRHVTDELHTLVEGYVYGRLLDGRMSRVEANNISRRSADFVCRQVRESGTILPTPMALRRP